MLIFALNPCPGDVMTTRASAARFLPFMTWPAQWARYGIRGDIIAGLTVALVMVPQSLAYAQLGSLPPYIGLYAALLPALTGALFGSCGQLSTGPVALTSLLTGASLLPLARPDTPEFLALAILLALMSGLIQLALGVMRLGWLLNLLSHPVLMGFINAAALVICMSQLPPLVGIKLNNGGQFLADFLNALSEIGNIHLQSAAFGIGALVALSLLRRLAPRLPGVLIVVGASIVISAWQGFAAQGGAVVGAIPAGLPAFLIPDIRTDAVITLLPTAFVIALVSFMEAASSAKVISGKLREPWDQNQELIGQGLAKLASAFTGSLPTSSSFSRSALNYNNGARTGLSALVTVAVVVVTLIFFTPLLWHLPKPVLAAVILQAVFNLLDFEALKKAWRANRDDGVAAALTFIATLAFAPNIQNGILTGLLLSLSLMVYRSMTPRVALLGLHDDGTYRDLDRFDLSHPHPHVVILRFDSPLTFVTAATFEDATLQAARAQPDVRAVLISGAGINAIDATGLHMLTALVDRFALQGQSLAFCGLKKQVIDAMQRDGLWPRIAAHAAYRTEQQALDHLYPGAGERLRTD